MSGKKFTFSLHSVLKLRRHKTEQARQALARAVSDIRQQETRVAQARQRLDALPSTLPTGQAIGPLTLRQRDAFRRDAQHTYDEACRELARLRQVEAEARAHLIQMRQNEETLQTLHDQQKAAFLKEQETSETTLLDEQALSGYHRKKQAP